MNIRSLLTKRSLLGLGFKAMALFCVLTIPSSCGKGVGLKSSSVSSSSNSSPFSLDDIDGLSMWFSADYFTEVLELADGANLVPESWEDYSGFTSNLTAAYQSLFNTIGGANNQPYVNFNTAGGMFTAASGIGSMQSFSLFFIGGTTVVTANLIQINGSVGGDYLQITRNSSPNRITAKVSANGFQATADVQDSTLCGSFCIMEFYWDHTTKSATLKIHEVGENIGSPGNASMTSSSYTGTLQIGGSGAIIHVYETFLYNRLLNQTERDEVNSYLMDVYGE